MHADCEFKIQWLSSPWWHLSENFSLRLHYKKNCVFLTCSVVFEPSCCSALQENFLLPPSEALKSEKCDSVSGWETFKQIAAGVFVFGLVFFIEERGKPFTAACGTDTSSSECPDFSPSERKNATKFLSETRKVDLRGCVTLPAATRGPVRSRKVPCNKMLEVKSETQQHALHRRVRPRVRRSLRPQQQVSEIK